MWTQPSRSSAHGHSGLNWGRRVCFQGHQCLDHWTDRRTQVLEGNWPGQPQPQALGPLHRAARSVAQLPSGRAGGRGSCRLSSEREALLCSAPCRAVTGSGRKVPCQGEAWGCQWAPPPCGDHWERAGCFLRGPSPRDEARASSAALRASAASRPLCSWSLIPPRCL